MQLRAACSTRTPRRPSAVPAPRTKTAFSEDFEGELSGVGHRRSPRSGLPRWSAPPWEFSRRPAARQHAGRQHSVGLRSGSGQGCRATGAPVTSPASDYLTSPAITVGAAGDAGEQRPADASTTTSQTEIGFDGGTVQISKDGGTTWIDVPAEAYAFNEPTVAGHRRRPATPTRSRVSRASRAPTAARSSPTGAPRSSTCRTRPAVANGESIKVRFAIGRDGCGGVVGWWVDNVKVTTCETGVAATVSAVHAPEPSTFGSASAVNVTVTGAGGTPSGQVTVKEGATTLGTATLDAPARRRSRCRHHCRWARTT